MLSSTCVNKGTPNTNTANEAPSTEPTEHSTRLAALTLTGQQTLSTPLLPRNDAQVLRKPNQNGRHLFNALTPCAPVIPITLTEKDNHHVDFKFLNQLMERATLINERDTSKLIERFPNVKNVLTMCNANITYALEEDPITRYQTITIGRPNHAIPILENLQDSFSYNHDLGIYTHKAFSQDALKIFHQLLVDSAISLGKPITVTGHSSAGGIANLLMCHLYNSGFKLSPSATFGQPKVVNDKGAQLYDDIPLTRVVTQNDIIPFLPSTTLMHSLRGPYQQMGEEIILLDGNDYHYLDAHDENRKSATHFNKNTFQENIPEHQASHYRLALAAKQHNANKKAYEKQPEHSHTMKNCLKFFPCCKC